MKKLYNTLTQQILPYPRNDDFPIVGLDSDLVILIQVQTNPPNYDPDTQELISTYIVDLVLNEYRQQWSIQDKPLKPNWDNFNTQMMTNPRFNQVYNQCLQVAPIVCASLPTALDQVTSKPSLSLFTLIWSQLCQIGGATAEDKIVWGEYAEANNLPQEFITILVS